MSYCTVRGDSEVSLSCALFPIVPCCSLRLLQLQQFILVILVLLPRTDTLVPCAKAPSTHTLSRLWRIWTSQRVQKLTFPLPCTDFRIWAEPKTRCYNVVLQIGTRPIEAQRVRPMCDAPATVAWDVA